MKLEQVKETMDTNGFCYTHKEIDEYINFPIEKRNEPFYIPENAEDLGDVYSYNDLVDICHTWLLRNKWYHYETNCTEEDLLFDMIESLSWESPFTWLDQLNN